MQNNLEPCATHSMQDTFRMEVFKSQEDLFSKILGNVLFETPIFTKATSHGTARNIFQETLTNIRSDYLAEKITYMLRKFGVSSNPRYWTMFG
jgi:fructose-bisphosphate aldolase class 1